MIEVDKMKVFESLAMTIGGKHTLVWRARGRMGLPTLKSVQIKEMSGQYHAKYRNI